MWSIVRHESEKRRAIVLGMKRVLAALVLAACGPAPAQPTASVPPTITFAAEPTRPPSCPSNYPDSDPVSDRVFIGTATVVAVIDGTLMRATVEVPLDHPFAGQTLLLHLHGSARIPGGVRDLIAYGLRSGDRIDIDVWKLLPADCSYIVTRVEKRPLATAGPREMPTAADERLVGAFAAFARAPDAGTLAGVPFAEKVRLGLSDRIVTERASLDLVRPDAWVLQEVPFRGRVGPFSARDLLATNVPTTISVGPHPHCASPPVPPPADLVGSRRVSVQPTGIDTCLLWWTVDLFVSPAGRIEAVTLDLWDP